MLYLIITILAGLAFIAICYMPKRRRKPSVKECRLCCEPATTMIGYCRVHFKIEAGKAREEWRRLAATGITLAPKDGDDDE